MRWKAIQGLNAAPIRIANRADSDAVRLGNEFGLTPSARVRLVTAHTSNFDDLSDKFIE